MTTNDIQTPRRPPELVDPRIEQALIEVDRHAFVNCEKDGLVVGGSIRATLGVTKHTLSQPILMTEELLEMFGASLFLYLFVLRFLLFFNQSVEEKFNHAINHR
jgi:hypothetical protein